MTATEMYDAFMRGTSLSGYFAIPSWDVAKYLNQAQRALFNKLFYPEGTKSALASVPMQAYQSDFKFAEDLAPFRVSSSELTTTRNGFLQYPNELVRITDVMISKTSYANLCEDENPESNYVRCRFLRDMERAGVGENVFTRPTWNSNDPVFRNRPRFMLDKEGGVLGIRVLPKGRYYVIVKYLTMPPDIQIENPAIEMSIPEWTANPAFVTVSSDVNCLFPADRHQEIVSMALAIFFKDRSDPESAKSELESIDADLT